MKVVNDKVCHKGSNIWVSWIKINCKKICLEQKQTKVGQSLTYEIINGNSENIS